MDSEHSVYHLKRKLHDRISLLPQVYLLSTHSVKTQETKRKLLL